MRILIFDLQITGHHSEYISHLVNYVVDEQVPGEYYFVVNPLFTSVFPEIVTKSLKVKNIHWIAVEAEEITKVEQSKIIKKSFISYNIMDRYAQRFSVNHVVLMVFNIFQLALAVKRPSYTLSGILFKQFFRMDKEANYLLYYRKFLQTWLFVLNKNITKVFVLNDNKTVNAFNDKLNTSIFSMLPDPVPQLIPLENFDIYKAYGISRRKKIFLHIGALNERKGTLDIIEAMSLLKSNVRDDVVVLIVGKAQPDFSSKIKEKINQSLNAEMVIWDEGFISNEKMKSLFNQCFCVLMPYKNVEASSGILGHAAVANKMVIATGQGLLKEIIEDNSLGLLIEQVSPRNIADIIEKAVVYDFDASRSDAFLKNRTGKHFASQVLSQIN